MCRKRVKFLVFIESILKWGPIFTLQRISFKENAEVEGSMVSENTNEYIRSLIRRDLHSRTEALEWLKKELEPALRADESEFIAVYAQDVIKRNNGR